MPAEDPQDHAIDLANLWWTPDNAAEIVASVKTDDGISKARFAIGVAIYGHYVFPTGTPLKVQALNVLRWVDRHIARWNQIGTTKERAESKPFVRIPDEYKTALQNAGPDWLRWKHERRLHVREAASLMAKQEPPTDNQGLYGDAAVLYGRILSAIEHGELTCYDTRDPDEDGNEYMGALEDYEQIPMADGLVELRGGMFVDRIEFVEWVRKQGMDPSSLELPNLKQDAPDVARMINKRVSEQDPNDRPGGWTTNKEAAAYYREKLNDYGQSMSETNAKRIISEARRAGVISESGTGHRKLSRNDVVAFTAQAIEKLPDRNDG